MNDKDKERREDPESDEFFAHAHNGLFKGGLLLAVVILVIILSSIYTDSSEFAHYVIEMLQYGFILLINSLQIVAVIHGVWCFRRLETTLERSNQIDQVLLILSVTGLILLQIFIMFGVIDGLYYESEELFIDRKRTLDIELAGNIMTVVFAILQSCFILQGLQTHTSCKEHQRNKPGRETVTFLVVSNIAMWLYSSFTNELVSYEVSYYYGGAWPIISSICRPLGLFFRFHSSICFADIWSIAYMAEEGGLKYKEFWYPSICRVMLISALCFGCLKLQQVVAEKYRCLDSVTASFQLKCRFLAMGIPIIKISQSWDHPIFIIGIPTLARRQLHIETWPCPDSYEMPAWITSSYWKSLPLRVIIVMITPWNGNAFRTMREESIGNRSPDTYDQFCMCACACVRACVCACVC